MWIKERLGGKQSDLPAEGQRARAPRRRARPCGLGQDRPLHDTSLFPRLVLGWINADFRVQIRIFQHFSKSTRKSSSRKQNVSKFLQLFANFLRILQNFANFQEFSEIFKKNCKNFCSNLQNFVDFEKCYIGCQKFCKFC